MNFLSLPTIVATCYSFVSFTKVLENSQMVYGYLKFFVRVCRFCPTETLLIDGMHHTVKCILFVGELHRTIMSHNSNISFLLFLYCVSMLLH